MSSLLGLPVKDDACVGPSQVDSQSTSSGTEHEDKDSIISFVSGSVGTICFFCVENVHLLLPIVNLRAAVDSAILPIPKKHVVFHDVQDSRHLTKDKHLVPILVKTGQHTVQQGEFSTGANQQLRMRCTKMNARMRIHRLPKEKWVINVLTVIHHFVGLAQSSTLFDALRYQSFAECALLNQVGISSLQLGDTRVNNDFPLGGHFLENVGLDSAKQERTQDLVQFCNCLILLLLPDNGLFVACSPVLLSDILKTKPGLKDGQVVKNTRIYKIEETPKLVECICNGKQSQMY